MSAKDNLLPTKLEVVFYSLLSAVIIFLANIGSITEFLASEPEANVTAKDALQTYTDQIINSIESLPFLPNGAVFVFWSIIGLVLYSFSQSVFSIYKNIKDDVDIDRHFLHPRNYVSWQFTAEVTLQFLAHMLIYSLIILWSFLVAKVLIPLTSAFATEFFGDIGFKNFFAFLTSFILLTSSVIIFAVIIKLFFKRKQLII